LDAIGDWRIHQVDNQNSDSQRGQVRS
jgi:hypothetical protein